MEQAIKRALLLRSTLYKDIDASLLSSLAAVAEQHVLAAKGLATAFDKFMTVTRSVSILKCCNHSRLPPRPSSRPVLVLQAGQRSRHGR